MYRIHLTDAHQSELLRLTRLGSLSPATRTRLEMVRLSDAGWSVPRIAPHLHQHEQTVRSWVKAFLSGGFDALSDKPRPGKRATVSAETLRALASEIGKGDRTWNSVQAQAWLALRGVSLKRTQVRHYLRQLGLRYKRTARTLRHKQNAEEVAEKQVALATVQKGGMSST